jgi:hypothetical protein
MFRRFSTVLSLIFVVLLVRSTTAQTPRQVFLPLVASPERPVTITIDPQLQPSVPALPGLRGGPPRPVGALVQADGPQIEFVANEVRLKPQNEADLQAFLTTYNGTVIHDGVVPAIPDMEEHQLSTPAPRHPYLIRIDPQRVSTARVIETMQQAGAGGAHRFSSDEALRLVALVTGERRWQIRPNFLVQPHAVLEHRNGAGGHIDASQWVWMTEDDDPNQAGDQGLSVGVVHAWDYLRYHNLPPQSSGVWEPPFLAIIDTGFALDTITGVPLNDNYDFYAFGNKPYQYDMVDSDTAAGGEALMKCGGKVCPWHGQGAFGVAAARSHNRYGTAGIAGPVAVPLLIRVDGSTYTWEMGLKTAVFNGADVVSMSVGNGCEVAVWICRIPPDDAWDDVRRGVDFARSSNVIVVASAGNDGEYQTEKAPCRTRGVICVGAVGHDGIAKNYSNWGPVVDIWAPTDIYSTPNPETYTNTGISALPIFGGTSAAAPFVGGVIALMRTLKPNLSVEEASTILHNTANPSTDPKVTTGYVDAYRAVQATKAHQPPTVAFTQPVEGGRVSWRVAGAYFVVQVSDPETPGRFYGQVALRSDREGPLCRAISQGQTELNCSGPSMSLGTHMITASAVDQHGAETSVVRSIEVVNYPPIPMITYPFNNGQFYTSQTITFQGMATDADEEIADTALVWTSSRMGVLGTGRSLSTRLTAGTHTIQLTATDIHGATATTSINLTVAVGEGVPTARILSPAPNTLGQEFTFIGQGIDPEEGELPGTRLRWYSSEDGFLGTGKQLTKRLSGPPIPCEPEIIPHIITLEVTDSDGKIGRHQIRVNVGFVC